MPLYPGQSFGGNDGVVHIYNAASTGASGSTIPNQFPDFTSGIGIIDASNVYVNSSGLTTLQITSASPSVFTVADILGSGATYTVKVTGVGYTISGTSTPYTMSGNYYSEKFTLIPGTTNYLTNL